MVGVYSNICAAGGSCPLQRTTTTITHYAPVGYVNNVGADGKRIITPHPKTAPAITLLSELFVTGEFSLEAVARKGREEGLALKAEKLYKSEVHYIPSCYAPSARTKPAARTPLNPLLCRRRRRFRQIGRAGKGPIAAGVYAIAGGRRVVFADPLLKFCAAKAGHVPKRTTSPYCLCESGRHSGKRIPRRRRRTPLSPARAAMTTGG